MVEMSSKSCSERLAFSYTDNYNSQSLHDWYFDHFLISFSGSFQAFFKKVY